MRGAERDLTVGVSNNPVDRWTSMAGGYATRPDSSATTGAVTVHSSSTRPNPHGRPRHGGYQLSQLLVRPGPCCKGC
jgi:hypothetical protein